MVIMIVRGMVIVSVFLAPVVVVMFAIWVMLMLVEPKVERTILIANLRVLSVNLNTKKNVKSWGVKVHSFVVFRKNCTVGLFVVICQLMAMSVLIFRRIGCNRILCIIGI